MLGESGYRTLLRDATAEWFAARVADGHTVLVAHDLSGLAVFGPNSLEAPADRELRNVYVEPGATSRGLGAALAGAALGRMRSEGWGAVCLGVFPTNFRAIAFYERLGFRRHRTGVWENQGVAFEDLVMVRDLSSPVLEP